MGFVPRGKDGNCRWLMGRRERPQLEGLEVQPAQRTTNSVPTEPPRTRFQSGPRTPHLCDPLM